MGELVKCEIIQIDEPKEYQGEVKRKVHLKLLDNNKMVIASTNFKPDSNQFEINWKKNSLPNWLKTNNTINLPMKEYMNYSIIDSFDDRGVEILEGISLEDIADDLDDVGFEYGNNVRKEKPQGNNGNGGEDDPTLNRINNMAELYAKIFKAIHTHDYLSKLDTGLKKDIATSFFIQLNR
jgi:hypothetical protein